ncbi:MAG: hypothetical protein ISS15_11845 [Alphaproteobacteria bacterium]|nr:hypothetical protein [Alphaproteobacteria bacterium]MBL6936605.1 hypothetical protein [Alphaproteobacteria bacterium]MBL7098344.1 hypothetical protein [Alphaproteobacteria bacterium]
MKQPPRVELFTTSATFSVPIRLHPVYIPHAVLIAVIVLASVANAVMQAADWIVQP